MNEKPYVELDNKTIGNIIWNVKLSQPVICAKCKTSMFIQGEICNIASNDSMTFKGIFVDLCHSCYKDILPIIISTLQKSGITEPVKTDL